MRIQQAQNISSQALQSQNVPQLAKQLKNQINTLSSQLQSLLTSPEQSEDPVFLGSLKNTLIALSETSKQINGE